MSKSVLMFTILTLITIIAWVFFSVFRQFTQTQVSEEIQNNLKPISSTFDSQYLTDIYNSRNKQ